MEELNDYYKVNLICMNCGNKFSVFVPIGTAIHANISLETIYHKKHNENGSWEENIECPKCKVDRPIRRNYEPEIEEE